MATTPPDFAIDLVGCARCKGDGHPGLEFRRLAHPIELTDPPLTHWATCPTTGDPILLRYDCPPDGPAPA